MATSANLTVVVRQIPVGTMATLGVSSNLDRGALRIQSHLSEICTILLLGRNER